MMGRTMLNRYKTALILIIVVAAFMVAVCLGGCDSAKSEAQDAFKQASAELEEKNAEINAAISDLQSVMSSEIKPLDDTTLKAADAAISTAQSAKMAVPEMASETEAIKEQTAEIEKVDYAKELEGMATAKSDLEKSIKQREQVTNPSEAFILERLANVEHVKTPTAATEDNDPNTLLHKQGGYNVSVFFDTDLFDSSDIPEAYGVGVVGKGVEGGGEVEVYTDEEGSIARDQYIGSFDGTPLAPGSHYVIGTCVIRTSENLTATQQKELTQAIIDELTRLD